jgi:ribosomal protein S27AE
LHLYGSCIGGSGTGATDYSGYNVSHDSTCFSTHCPKCGEEVFFIQHNGGSVWIDPPLGPPWYKHSCFDAPSTTTTRTSLSAEYKLSGLDIETEAETGQVIGIVKSTRVDILKRYTDIRFETGKREASNIRLEHNAGFLLGKLCIYDPNNAEIRPVDEPSYVYAIYNPSPPNPDLVDCPKCGVKLNPRNLYKHLRRQHGIN